MSLEKNIERIADALEILAGSAPPKNFKDDGETSASENPKVTPKTAAEKKAEKAKKAKAAKEKKATEAAAAKADGEVEENDTTREDVRDALKEFVTDGPGKAAAKDVFEEFKAGSISTLDEDDYGAFIARLTVIAGG